MGSGQAVGSAFYAMSGATDGTFDAALNSSDDRDTENDESSAGPDGRRITGRIDYSVGFIPTSPATPFPIPSKVRVFAQADASKPAFPRDSK